MVPHEIQQYQCLKGGFPFSTVLQKKCNWYISQLSNLLDKLKTLPELSLYDSFLVVI